MTMSISQVLGILALLGMFAGGVRAWTEHLADDARRDLQIWELQKVTISEHPEYNALIDWIGTKGAP